jgi:hypothetical protein
MKPSYSLSPVKSRPSPSAQPKTNSHNTRKLTSKSYGGSSSLGLLDEAGTKNENSFGSPLRPLRVGALTSVNNDRKNEERIFLDKLNMLPSLSPQPKSFSITHNDFQNSSPIFRRGRYDVFGANGIKYDINTHLSIIIIIADKTIEEIITAPNTASTSEAPKPKRFITKYSLIEAKKEAAEEARKKQIAELLALERLKSANSPKLNKRDSYTIKSTLGASIHLNDRN